MPAGNPSRRRFLKSMVGTAALAASHQALAAGVKGKRMSETAAPIRAITQGPKFHWFGYYDKLQFDPSGRYCLGMEVGFEHRSPRPDDAVKIGMVDLKDGDSWTELGESRGWCWQQGCMLQWLPGSKSEIVWNDREGDHYCCQIMDAFTRKKRTVPHPVYTISPHAKIAVAPDFRRVNDCRPGYGYCGLPDPYKDEPTPKDAGIWRIDLASGKQELIISLADIAQLAHPPACPAGEKQWFNHLLFNQDGSRFIFLNRWWSADRRRLVTRMYTATPDGKDIHFVVGGLASHFIWRDPSHILVWAGHPSHGDCFYLFEDKTANVEAIGKGVMAADGHCSYLPNKDWIVSDRYPGADRKRPVYLYHVPTGRVANLGWFYTAKGYDGEWRCDTHPRYTPDGRSVCIDSVHEEKGRQLYLIDVGAILDNPPKA
ncbi:MAG: hypothetical protein FJ291_25070 [Planctomycetes bacterium]|nr:hypothetical protein [Planctomycetota bacterium]